MNFDYGKMEIRVMADLLAKSFEAPPSVVDLVFKQLAKIKFEVGQRIRVDRSADKVFKNEDPFTGTIHTIQIFVGEDHNQVRYWTDHDDYIAEDEGHLVSPAGYNGKWMLRFDVSKEVGLVMNLWASSPTQAVFTKHMGLRFQTELEAVAYKDKHCQHGLWAFQAVEDA